MSDFKRVIIKSHLTTTNIYRKRAIVALNIANIITWQNNTPNQNIKAKVWFKISGIYKQQKSLLVQIDLQIQVLEQHSLAFGSPLFPQQ